MNLRESIRRILREKLTARIRRRIPYDEMENEFFESFDSAYNLTKRKKLFLDELIYTTITMMMDGVHWRFVSTIPEDEFWYDDIHKELENHYRDRITQMYNERRGIQESILREETELPISVRRRVSMKDLDDLVLEVKSLIDSGYDKIDAIYDTLRQFIASKKSFKFNNETEQQYWDSYIEIEKPLVDYVKKKLRMMDGVNESVLRENDYSPAGKEVIPNKIVVHKSNPMFRDKILQDGLKVKARECYKIYVGDGTKCKPAIFATNSTNKRAWFDSTYDDDIWEINTEMIPDVKWFKDRHYESRSKHIVTFQDIPREAISLKYKGSGSGDAETWDKNSPNLFESIRRILKETLESEWNKGNYDYQHGYCHYFAYNIIDKIKKKFPKKDIKYYLLLASEVDKETQEPIQEYLIHVYIKIDDLLLDSNGFTTQSEAWQRAQEWEQRQSHLVPEEYETEVWEEESDEIPEYFFNNSFCNTKRVKQDLKDFLSHPSVQKLLVEK